MSGERVGKVLERVAREQHQGRLNEQGLLAVLEERLGPLLRAGQAMRETVGFTYISQDWDAALAALERER